MYIFRTSAKLLCVYINIYDIQYTQVYLSMLLRLKYSCVFQIKQKPLCLIREIFPILSLQMHNFFFFFYNNITIFYIENQ